MPTAKIDHKTVCGVTTRTTNAAEASGKGKLQQLWADFSGKVKPHVGGEVYAVYHDYESDVNGAYSVLVGGICAELTSPVPKAQQATIPAGTYRQFDAEGPMPQTAIQLWQNIWDHYESSDEKRAFTTDFELYHSPEKLSILIAEK